MGFDRSPLSWEERARRRRGPTRASRLAPPPFRPETGTLASAEEGIFPAQVRVPGFGSCPNVQVSLWKGREIVPTAAVRQEVDVIWSAL